MNYVFQSRHRNADMSTLAAFRNFVFVTENQSLAEKIRECVGRNPHDYWEITKEVANSEATPAETYQKKVGRPPKTTKIIRGFRDSEQSQGESV